MYRVAITRDFIARHFLVGGDWGAENDVHSHHYRCEICVEGADLDRHGFLVDIVELNDAADAALSEVRDRVLNELPMFAGLNPSLEHFSRMLWGMLLERAPLHGKTLTVTLWENERDWAAYKAVAERAR